MTSLRIHSLDRSKIGSQKENDQGEGSQEQEVNCVFKMKVRESETSGR